MEPADWEPEFPAAPPGTHPQTPFSLNAGAIVGEIVESQRWARPEP